MTRDCIEWYSNIELKRWLRAFDEFDSDVITLPGIPFSYPEIRREIIQRDQNRQEAERLMEE